jgi:hypothetical protein
MDRKVLAILMILLAGASFMTIGCAGKRNTEGEVPTIAPTATPGQAPANMSSNNLNLDPSIANISGEGMDEGGFPETGLPTPTLD